MSRRIGSSRREFLAQSSLVALAPAVPAFLSQTAMGAGGKEDGRILVVIQLDGGNDGLSTVVPYTDDNYLKHRIKTLLPVERLIKIDDRAALHPGMRRANELLQGGKLAIVQGVGYPNSDRSHAISMAVWQTARTDREEHKTFGWIGRALDQTPPPASGAASSMLVGTENIPIAARGRRSISSALADINEMALDPEVAALRAHGPKTDVATASTEEPADDLASFSRRSTLQAYATVDLLDDSLAGQKSAARPKYPFSRLASRLETIARLIKADFGTRVYYTIQSGYDTHYAQESTHYDLLRGLSDALKAFLDDMKAAGLDERVLALCFSEFGRTLKENASSGTDHGSAGPVMLAGGKVVPGLHGKAPDLADLENDEPKPTVDFRRVYASILRDWLAVDPVKTLGAAFEPLPLFTG